MRLVQLLVIDFLGVNRENMNMVERNNRGAVAAEQTAGHRSSIYSSFQYLFFLSQSTSSLLAFIAVATAIAIVDGVPGIYRTLDICRNKSLVSIEITLTIRARVLSVAPSYWGMSQ